MSARKRQDFEARLERLQELLDELEREDVPLEKGMLLYKEGVELVRACREQLEKARYEVQVLQQEAAPPQGQAERVAGPEQQEREE